MTAWGRWRHPQPLTDAWTGVAVSAVASAINGAVAVVLLRAGRRMRSITLRADGYHLLTDVWTSAGVIVGIALVALTGWVRLDPLIAFAVAVNIIWTGWRLVRDTGTGLLDAGIPEEERKLVTDALAPFQESGVLFHAMRSRVAGTRRFVSMHVLVPGELDRSARPRPLREDRGRRPRGAAADDGVHAPRAARGSGELGRPEARPGLNGVIQPPLPTRRAERRRAPKGSGGGSG